MLEYVALQNAISKLSTLRNVDYFCCCFVQCKNAMVKNRDRAKQLYVVKNNAQSSNKCNKLSSYVRERWETVD